MSNRIMLINGRHAEQLRVAVVEGGVLQLYDVEGTEATLKRGNIYRGVVANIERSLNAAFVEFGDAKHGFLTRHDVIPQAFHRAAGDAAPIDQILQKGQPLVVQVTRDAEGGKGATLTTNISLAGRFLVYFPYDAQRGVSRKVEDEALRRKLREKAKDLDLDESEGVIVRTNAAEQTKADLKADLQILQRLWKAAVEDTAQGRGAKIIYDDQDLLIHSLRDNLDTQIAEVLIDDEQLHAKAEKYVQAVMPRAKVALKLYAEPAPLFSRYNVESQIASIYSRTVGLPGGGAIVIDHAEALTAIDVNSGKSKAGKNQGDTASHTNLEAAAEVGRQLRLRDIGGLVVVDFIDMRSRAQRHDVEKALKEAMKPDRARHEIGRIGENGLVEINRQRIRSALQLRTRRICPTCDGVGRIISPELLSLNLVRRIEGRAAAGRLARAKVVLHAKVADYVQNNRRRELADLERAYRIVVEIVGDPGAELSTERYEWFDVPAWEIPSVPERRPADEEDDRAPAVAAVPSGAEPAETHAGDASRLRPAQEQRDGDGGGKRSRRKRRRRGGRNRDGSAQEPSPREWGAPPAASIGSVVEVEAEVNGNVGPATELSPADEEPRREPQVTTADQGPLRETEDAQPSSRRRRRRRRRSRGEGAAETREVSQVAREVSAEPMVVRRDEARQALPLPVAPPPVTAQPAPAPALAGARVPEARGEADVAPLAPREKPAAKKAPKRAASKKAALPKKPTKAAPKKAAVRKAAAGKAPPKSRE
ncbi:MAG: Rne/Rng family ribonuclease [Candidatus Methylomirabilia bacterium]